MHNVLNAIGLTHFLCYGSLWGQLRSSQSLPWESDIEFCLLNEEILTKDEVYLERNFRSRNMQMVYDSTEGVYTITDVAFPGGKIQLVVFEKDLVVSIILIKYFYKNVYKENSVSNIFPFFYLFFLLLLRKVLRFLFLYQSRFHNMQTDSNLNLREEFLAKREGLNILNYWKL